MPRQTRAALGFRAHTGWAAAIAVTADREVVERRRLAYEPEGTRFIYHRAAEIPSDQAEPLIATARAQVLDKAREGIQNLISALSGRGIAKIVACVPGGNTRLPTSLAEILAVHSRIHAAEGAFYRDALADACARIGIRVSRVPERDLWPLASRALRSSEDKLRDRVAALGKKLGPPWGEDQKLAALAAFVALKAQA
jgi:hypothetical protein